MDKALPPKWGPFNLVPLGSQCGLDAGTMVACVTSVAIYLYALYVTVEMYKNRGLGSAGGQSPDLGTGDT